MHFQLSWHHEHCVFPIPIIEQFSCFHGFTPCLSALKVFILISGVQFNCYLMWSLPWGSGCGGISIYHISISIPSLGPSSIPYPLVSFRRLAPTFQLVGPNKAKRLTLKQSSMTAGKALQAEIDALQRNHTWILVDLPAGKTPICCKWVCKVKYKPDGPVDRYKAGIVSKSYTGVKGIHFLDTFFPVAKMTTLRVVLSLASINN